MMKMHHTAQQRPIHWLRQASAAVVLGLCILAPRAQAQVDTADAVKKILTTIDEELSEIDKMLMEASKKDAVGNAERTEQLRRTIKETQGSQERVVRGIDKLIEELQKQNSGSGGGQEPSPEKSERSSDPMQDQQQGQREDGESQQQQAPKPRPGGEQQQEQPGQQQEGGEQNQPKDGQAKPTAGQQKAGGDPTEDAKGRTDREKDRASWGKLPEYDIHVHDRGGLPKVPEKYRKLLEEYLKQGQKTGRTRRR